MHHCLERSMAEASRCEHIRVSFRSPGSPGNPRSDCDQTELAEPNAERTTLHLSGDTASGCNEAIALVEARPIRRRLQIRQCRALGHRCPTGILVIRGAG